MPDYALTFDAQIPSSQKPGYFHRYDSRAIIRSLNGVTDGVSNQILWSDRASHTLMLRPMALDGNWLNTSAQAAYIQRLSAFQGYPANLTGLLVFEAAMLQNADNPFIFHSPISPTAPIAFNDSPEQIPGITQIETQTGESGSVTTFRPTAFPGVAVTDMKVICWGKSVIAPNMPLLLRWFVAADAVGHKTLYDFHIGQFCVRCGPSTVEVYEDQSPHGDRSGPWALRLRSFLFVVGGDDTLGNYGNSSAARVEGHNGQIRSLLWLPYRRNYVYLESHLGTYAVLKTHAFNQTFTDSTGAADWDIVQGRNIAVAGLTPGPGAFQIQKVKFADGPGVFNLPPFTTDYLPTPAPANNWLVDEKDTPHGSTLTHTTPTAALTYTFKVNTVDGDCPSITTDPTSSEQLRTYGSVYTLTPGTDPMDGSLKTYTPQFYGTEVRIPNETTTWPVTATTITNRSLAAPSARIKSARISAQVGSPGSFEAEVTDLGASLAAYYSRQYFPLQFSDQNSDPTHPLNWTTLWLGVADAPRTRELRLDTVAPREITFRGTDFWKWLNDQVMRDNRDWTGAGHISVVQNVLQQAGVSITGWDGPAAGTGYDDPLGGLNINDPALTDSMSNTTENEALKPVWRPQAAPPDSYGSFIKRIAEVWAGWDYGFHPDGTFYYHRWDYYSTSEVVFHKSRQANPAGPCYLKGSVQRDPLFPDANVVQFVAGSNGGSLRYSNLFVDFASLYKPTAVNFMGKGKAIIMALPGWTSCAALNAAARKFFDRARRRRLRIRFRGDYLPGLKIGHCFQLEGISGTWRLQSVSAQYERKTWNQADMEGELVEQGFN